MHVLLRGLTLACPALALLLSGCSVQESTRSDGLVAPTGPVATAVAILESPAPTDRSQAAVSTSQRSRQTSALPTATTGAQGDAADAPPPADGPAVPTTVSLVEAADSSGPSPTAPPTVAPVPTTTTPDSSPTESTPAADARDVLAASDPPEGFGEGVLSVTGPAGTRIWPVVIADTPQSRQQGLMGVADFASLGGYAATVFVFDADTSGAFWMRDTPLPLRITFVAASGSVVSATDMTPCLPPTPAGDCAIYHADGPYRIAIEHPAGPEHDIGLATAEFVELVDLTVE